MPCLLLDQFYHDYVNESRRSLFFGGAGGILRKFTNFAMPLLKEGAFGTPTRHRIDSKRYGLMKAWANF